jgi:hypothetical protein
MYSAQYAWGTIEDHKFEAQQLNEMKQSCQKTLLLDTEPQAGVLL